MEDQQGGTTATTSVTANSGDTQDRKQEVLLSEADIAKKAF